MASHPLPNATPDSIPADKAEETEVKTPKEEPKKKDSLADIDIPDDSFVHLHLHTGYSLLDGAVHIKKLVKHLGKLGMRAAAITDHGNMYGVIEFYQKMKKEGIKPIIGVETYVGSEGMAPAKRGENRHLVLLAENMQGYENLCYLISEANLNGFYRKARIDRDLLREHAEGLIGLSACLSGEIPVAILGGDMARAKEIAADYAEIFGEGNFFLELQKNGLPRQDVVNEGLVELAKEMGLPLVATNDVHYLASEEADLHDSLLCIGRNQLKADPDRDRYETDAFFLRSTDSMKELFEAYPEAIRNTVEIAKRCTVDLELDKPRLPRFDTPEGYTEADYFTEQTWKGFEERLADLPYEIDRSEYEARLEYEIKIIREMDFPGYFLIVADFINWAKEHGIPVGPGRGSGAGSLVAYSLKITDLDPLRHGLIFERFLNPERISMPDFDVDFCRDRRDEVIQYVARKYGEDHVGQIVTFGSLKAKAVVKDVGRAFDIPLKEVNALTKLIDDKPDTTLESALDKEPKLSEAIQNNPDFRRLFDTARGLEGLQRHTGVHAAGIVIGEKPLWYEVPIIKSDTQSPKYNLVTQYAKKEVEAVGLVKFDFLGLKTLTVIAEALRLINKERPKDDPFRFDSHNFDDPAVYKLIQAGDTNGVFQLESPGFQRKLKSLKPKSFGDIVMAVAIYRPGPMEKIPQFVARIHGREPISTAHPILDPILEETYGMIVYQEQVMRIAVDMAGFTMGGADKFRKAMGKKDKALMERTLNNFKEGALNKGFEKNIVEKVAQDIKEFAKYGFNKSHAAAYAMITYQTAYLKAHYPMEFMAATLTCDMEDTKKVVKFVGEARALGLELLPPSIVDSTKNFSVEQGKIRYGLGAIKGVGYGAIDAIIEARENHEITSLYTFCEHVDLKRVNKKAIEALIKAGAFDFTGIPRQAMMAVMEKAVANGQARAKERESGQTSIMDLLGTPNGDKKEEPSIEQEDYPDLPEWPESERLEKEHEALGLYLTAHPMDRYMKDVRRFSRYNLSQAESWQKDEIITVAGIPVDPADKAMKNGSRRITFQLQDSFGMVECNIYQNNYEACQPYMKSKEPLLVTGRVKVFVEDESTEIKLNVNRIHPLLEQLKSGAKQVILQIPLDTTETRLSELRAILEKHPGDCRVLCVIHREGEYDAKIALPNLLRIDPSSDFFDEAERIVGANGIEIR